MLLALDFGNSTVDWKVVQEGGLERGAFPIERGVINGLRGIKLSRAPEAVFVASVNASVYTSDLAEVFPSAKIVIIESSESILGVVNNYDSPVLLGVDRWLAVVEAYNLRQNRALIFDFGSAITMDYVDEKGQYLGGYIVPGFQMMKKALLNNTDKVSIYNTEALKEDRLGLNTADAVNNGIFQMVRDWVISQIAFYMSDKTGEVYFTGGDAELFYGAGDLNVILHKDLVLDCLIRLGKS